MKYLLRSLSVCCLVVLLSGCGARLYRSNYSPMPLPADYINSFAALGEETEAVEVRNFNGNERDKLILMENGYIPIGESRFVLNQNVTVVALRKVAKEKGADVVLRSKVLVKGSEPFWCYSTNGQIMYGMTDEYYLYYAMFFRKGNFGDFYGTILLDSPNFPDSNPTAPYKVKVVAVIKGSQAERDGIRGGQKVLTINGTPIKSEKDFERFACDLKSIKSMTAEDDLTMKGLFN